MAIIELTEENINKLLNGRSIMDEYKPLIEAHPNNINIIKNRDFKLLKAGFSLLANFTIFNMTLNVMEFDRCYRMRPIGHPYLDPPPLDSTNAMTPDDFCCGGSLCRNRGLPPCLPEDHNVITCYNSEPMFLQFFPYEKSEMVREFKEYAKKCGVVADNLLLPHPYFHLGTHLVDPINHVPPHCLGVLIQINTPRFDMYWGMERELTFGIFQNEIRNRLIDGD